MKTIETIKQLSSEYEVCSRWCTKCSKHRYHKCYEEQSDEGEDMLDYSVECLKCHKITYIGTSKGKLEND